MMLPLLLLLAANSAAGLASPELFVAPGGSATAAGTQADPLGGIREARDAARKLAKPVTVRIAAGRYHAGSAAIAFDERDSGVSFVGPGSESTAGDKALAGEAVVYGGVRVTGWQRHGGIWRARWSGARFYALTEGNRAATLAREPDLGSGYLARRISKPFVTYSNGSLPASFDCSEPNQCSLYFSLGGFAEVEPVAAVNHSNRTISIEVMDRDPYGHDGLTSGYQKAYIQGAKEFISTNGEWALAGGFVYYRPLLDGTDPNDAVITACTAPRLLSVVGSSTAPDAIARNLSFTNISFVGSGFSPYWTIPPDTGGGKTFFGKAPYQSNFLTAPQQMGMVYLENASAVSVTGCRLLASGHSAVWMQGYAQHHVIQANWIEESGFMGVFIQSTCQPSSPQDRRRSMRRRVQEAPPSMCDFDSYSSPEEAYVSHHNTVRDNYILDSGRLIGWGAGIYLYESGENELSHNLISRTPRDGVGLFGAQVPFGQEMWGVLADFNSGMRIARTRHNHVAWNDISLTSTDTADTGDIEMYGIGTGNVIERNAIHDTYDENGMHSALFADDFSPNTTFHANIVFWARYGPVCSGDCDMFLIKSMNTTMSANVFADSQSHEVGALQTFALPAANGLVHKTVVWNMSLNQYTTVSTCDSKGHCNHKQVYDATHQEPPYAMRQPCAATCRQLSELDNPGCPFNRSLMPNAGPIPPWRNGTCTWSFPLGKGGFDFPPWLLDAPVVRSVDFNWYAGLSPDAFQQNGSWMPGGKASVSTNCSAARLPCPSGYPAGRTYCPYRPVPAQCSKPAPGFVQNYSSAGKECGWEDNSVTDATVSAATASDLFHRPGQAKPWHMLALEDYQVRAESQAAKKLGLTVADITDVTQIGVRAAHSRFHGVSEALRTVPAPFKCKLSAERFDRRWGVHDIRSVGVGPGTSGGAQGVHVDDGAWARFDRMDFGRSGQAVRSLSALVKGEGQLLFTLDAPTAASASTVLGTINVTKSSPDAWRVVNGTTMDTPAAPTGVHALYVVFVSTNASIPDVSVDWVRF
jgi:parallel beta-helix repeat protein